ncbi:MAG: hypothetical protein ONB05_06765 [candidate division KSB1 bacterium]|nr:hypothetical protein [candidate division KSB1 bacterium]
MNKKILDLLYRSFDSKLTKEEQQKLEKALAQSKELQEERARITKMRDVLSSSPAPAFKPFFVERVMRRIWLLAEKEKRQEIFFESLLYLFRRVALAGLLVLLALLSFNWIKSEQVSLSSALALPEITMEEIFVPILLEETL